MGLFDRADRRAKRLAAGPTLVLPADDADAVAQALLAYDPGVRARGDQFDFGNGVRLHGPVLLTPELAAQAGLADSAEPPAAQPTGAQPPGAEPPAAYYAEIADAGRGPRPDSAKLRDAERLVRGLAARLGGTVHSQEPIDLDMSVSVYCAAPVPPDQVISVLQPFTDDRLFVDDYPQAPGSYFLVSEEEPRFITVYWPPRFARSPLQPAPPALGDLADREPCRWELRTKHPAAAASPQIRRTLAEAALALSASVAGVVIDPYGFPVSTPEDLLAG
ncbi:MAG: hypothetical protein ACLQDY_17330 [Streptosporangiaceae bacterium]